ncbi:MAG: tetratricopeptide repeat protein [Anaerolineae bacterium]|nr:tetratricopeptide repeat protein [Anaerolineae bacterium]MDW8067616.1 tetratricopeptide repeat protein [Anaerolineae bacterium]
MPATKRIPTDRAEVYNQEGLQAYVDWDIERAVERFQAAIRLAPERAEYHLNLARAFSRAGDFDQALRALAEFLRLEPDSPVAERFERLFARGLDEVETILTEKMTNSGMPIEEIGAAMQMWLEYRIALGRESLNTRKPEAWAAALDYTVRKVNLRKVNLREIAALYGTSDRTVRERFDQLVATLDVMPCDYRYFVGEQNPLDKLVEAAELLEQLEARFRES